MGKKPSTAVAVQDDKTALPAYLQGYTGRTGAEDIEAADVTIPRIKLAQGISPEVKDGKVDDGDFFLNITGERLCKAGEELGFTVVARGKSYILWRDRKDGGGIFARAHRVMTVAGPRYAWDKPNQSFEHKIDGKTKVVWKTKEYVDEDGLGEWGTEIPGNAESGIAATAHHDFVIVLDDGTLAALSLSRTSAKKAKDLNALLKQGTAPIFARRFTMKSVDDKSDAGEYKNYQFKPAGFVSEEQFSRFKDLFDGFAVKGYTVDQSDEDQSDAGKTGKRGDKF